jgi:hypothetical protein
MSYNMMMGYDIYDHFTMEHFPLHQSMILTTSFFFARDRNTNVNTLNNECFLKFRIKVGVEESTVNAPLV